MEQQQQQQQQQQNEKAPGPLRPRVANACEACRFAKVKCQGSSQVGICKRCLASKRECIFKTGPRTRRPRGSRVTANQNSSITTDDNSNSNSKTLTGTTTETTTENSSPSSFQKQYPLPGGPPQGPSRTFTIDVPIPTASIDVAISLESLRLDHEGFMDHICPPGPNTGIDSEVEDDQYGYDYDEFDADGNWVELGGDGDASRLPGSGPSSVISSHASSLPLGASAATPGSSSASASGFTSGGFERSRYTKASGKGPGGGSTSSVASLSVQPQFNVDSASRLLDTFRKIMVWHFPCVLVDHVVYSPGYNEEGKVELEEATVASLARERPFVLLAVLAAASSTRTLQGHSLYDEEFRKILGLKFVAGGERSLELLQGLAVYVAWYPFHLRPKNRQAFQYVRMAVDMVNDLELDVDPGVDEFDGRRRPSPQRLEEIRTYLATYYVASNFATSWNRTPSMSFTSYTAKCCDILEKYSIAKGDRILPWLVRLQRLCEETNDLRKPQRGSGLPQQTESQIEMTIKGMEAQLNEWETKMPSDLKSVPSIRITTLFTRLFLKGAPLLKLTSVKLPMRAEKDSSSSSPFRADASRLLSLIPTLHENFEYFLSLSAHEINAFSMIGWGCLILSIILGFRMSFPITFCPEWDDFAARRVVRFDGFLERLCRLGTTTSSTSTSMSSEKETTTGKDKTTKNLTPATTTIPMPTAKGMDVLSAGKVVFAVVRRKFRNKVAKLERAAGSGLGSKGKRDKEDVRMGGFDVDGVGVCPVTGKAVGEGVVNPHTSGCLGEQHHLQPQQPFQHPQYQNHDATANFTPNNHYQNSQHSQSQQKVLHTHMNLPILPLELEVPTLHIPSTNISGCPMMDGSLEPYYPYWDETFAFSSTPGANTFGSVLGSGSGSGSGGSADTTRNGVVGSEQDVPEEDYGYTNGALPPMVPEVDVETESLDVHIGGENMGTTAEMGMGFVNDLWDTMITDWAGAGDGGFMYWAGDGRIRYWGCLNEA